MKNIQRLPALICLSLLMHCHVLSQTGSVHALANEFSDIPDSIQTGVYWYWLSDNISKEGIVKDLRAMKDVGINRAFIGNVAMDASQMPFGKIKVFTPEWWDALHTALKTAGELGIEIGIFNGPGWSQSGGPWVKPSQAMRYLAFADTVVEGGTHLQLKLKQPTDVFEDKFVIAYPFVSSDSITPQQSYFTKDNSIQLKHDSVIYFSPAKDFSVRSITLYPVHKRMYANASLYYKNGSGSYEILKNFAADRSNNQLNVGFDPYAAIAISLPQTNSDSFKLVFDHISDEAGFKNIVLSGSPVVEEYKEKSLAKMFQSPHPLWSDYQWKEQPAITDTSLLIPKNKVIDITAYLKPGGVLDWNAPAGNWIISRAGMTPTGVQNGPASPEATGLETDKMSKLHIASHFNAFIGEILKRIPPQDRKTFKVVVADSYETGGQNWTDSLRADFIKQYHYDPLSYLPVMAGKVVGSEDQSDRFLWDLRRLIADKVAYDYVGGLRDISHKYGLTTWLENYGHWGFPGEFLQYGGQSDEVGGEFWTSGDLGDIENKAASSAAHIYGKTKVTAESFTSGGPAFAWYPALLKARGDRFFCDGINNTLFHVYIEQPSDSMPGINTWFGTEFNRNNTWFSQMHPFTQYLKRCNLMLQQGKYVADVAYFIGEDAPKMTGIQDPALPKGYSFDYINAEVILNRLSVKNGRFVLPDGMSYALLVLPKLTTMRPELISKMKALVAAGGTILGPRPERSPSLQNYPEADAIVKSLATSLWGEKRENEKYIRAYGKGNVMIGYSLEEAFANMGIKPDMTSRNVDSVLFIHRRSADADIYFISNQASKKVSIQPVFRIAGKQPELWDAVDGSKRDLFNFKNGNGTIEVPLQLNASGSAFVVFRKQQTNIAGKRIEYNGEDTVFSQILKNKWQIKFDTAFGGPLQPLVTDTLFDWSKSTDTTIKYYSGKAIYTTSFTWKKEMAQHQKILLCLNNLVATAMVTINGQNAGGVWIAPYSIDISRFVKEGNNSLEVTVANNWVNRLIGDQRVPGEKRRTRLSYNPYKSDSDLQTSGLLGPVTITGIGY